MHGADEIAAQMQAENIDAMTVRVGPGISNLSFLEMIPRLRTLLVSGAIADCSAISGLSGLTTLHLLAATTEPVDFEALKSLKHCILRWNNRVESIQECTSLETLSIELLTRSDFGGFAASSKLQKLAVMGGSVSTLNGIERMPSLRHLRLESLRKLKSIAEVSGLRELQILELNNCSGVSSLNGIERLRNLQQLHFCEGAGIESLKPLETLHGLRTVIFYGSTRILDNDLSPLDQLPLLNVLSFQQRRSYSRKGSDFGEAYGRQGSMPSW